VEQSSNDENGCGIGSARIEAQTRAIPNLERFYAVSAIAQIIKNCKVLLVRGFQSHQILNLELLGCKPLHLKVCDSPAAQCDNLICNQ
jgi:hypothetical protein